MINLERIKINCPKCKKLICTMEYFANPKGIHFWCTRCKKEFEIINNIKNRAPEANNR